MKLELEVKTKEEAEKLIKQLQEFVEEEKDSLYPNIKDGEVYYYMTSTGDIRNSSYRDVSTECLANIYITREIAEKALQFKKSRKVWNFIENWAMHNSTFEPDWNDVWQYKYCICYSNSSNIWIRTDNVSSNCGVMYFSSEESEELLKILNSSDEYKL
jgi:hypothetical protein